MTVAIGGMIGRLGRLAIGAAFALGLSNAALAFPDQPITLVVPFAAGGTTDIEARLVAAEMEKLLKTQVIVENRAGGGGAVAARSVMQAKPDGHTIMLMSVSAAVINPLVNNTVGYDTERDFTPLALGTQAQLLFSVNPALAAQTYPEFAALLKDGKDVSYGVTGIGGVTHVGVLLFQQATGIKMVEVAYQGSAPALQALISGEVQASLSGLDWAPNVRANTIRGLFVTGTERVSILPDVPTAAELNIEGMDFGTWFAYFAPAGTPAETVKILNEAINTALQASKEKLQAGGARVMNGPPELLAETIKADHARWKGVIDKAGLKLQ